jgi:hypothetical protein
MARPQHHTLRIIKGEDFAYQFPALTDGMVGKIARIKRIEFAEGEEETDSIIFHGDVRDVLVNGARIKIEGNGDPDSNIELVISAAPTFDDDGEDDHASNGDPETICLFTAGPIPATILPNGYARRMYDMPVDLSEDEFTAEIRDEAGALLGTFTASGDELGVIAASMPAEDTADLDFARARFDIRRVADSDGEISFPFGGDVVLSEPVTEEA